MKKTMVDRDQFFSEAFTASDHIRYIAIYLDEKLDMKQRGNLENISSGESDKYEELLVNPTLLRLASQRGNIDCGGLHYFIIRYGNFFVLLFPVENGHVNFGIEPNQNPLLLVDPLERLLTKHWPKK